MAMSRSASDSSPSDVKSRRFPEGSHVGLSVPSKQTSPPVHPENVSPSPKGIGKGMEESGRITSAKLPELQTQFHNELTERSSKQHTSSPKRKITSNYGMKRGSRLNIHSSPALPFEERNTSVNSNESFLDYNSAKDESESLLKDQPKENSIRMSFWPWGKLLNMYSKIKKSPVPKLYSKENTQESLKEDGQRIQLIVYRCNEKNPMIFSHFRTTDSVGFVEMEIKKMLDVRHDVRLWKKGSNDESSLLQRADSTLKDAGILHEQHLMPLNNSRPALMDSSCLLPLFHGRNVLVKPFTMFVTDCTKISREEVQVRMQKMNFQ